MNTVDAPRWIPCASNGFRVSGPELLLAGKGTTVRTVAAAWGYVNLGLFAAVYKQRFGELPSQTLGIRN
ncbi:helix-turn-helix domain-containing protein [Cupriavidus basilensis]